MKRIWLKNIKKYAVVDDKDYKVISTYHWFGIIVKNNQYAGAYINGKTRRIPQLIHKWVRIRVIDHKDKNGLNNKRDNLRVVTQSMNIHNSRPWKHNTSGYTGVWEDKNRGWQAYITIKGKRKFTKYFIQKSGAINARKKFERKIYVAGY